MFQGITRSTSQTISQNQRVVESHRLVLFKKGEFFFQTLRSRDNFLMQHNPTNFNSNSRIDKFRQTFTKRPCVHSTSHCPLLSSQKHPSIHPPSELNKALVLADKMLFNFGIKFLILNQLQKCFGWIFMIMIAGVVSGPLCSTLVIERRTLAELNGITEKTTCDWPVTPKTQEQTKTLSKTSRIWLS